MTGRDTLSARGLICYRGDRCLFKGLDFEVNSRQLLMIAGCNGSGKTSLLKMIGGLRQPDEGGLYWNGKPIARMGSDYRQVLAYVGHRDGVKHELTVLENIRLLQQLFPQQDHTSEDILQQLKLTLQKHSLAGTLSAGQRRRLALARTLYSKARLWILDEPFSSLDKDTIGFFERALQMHLQANGLVVMTSHQEFEISGVEVQHLVISA